MCRLLSSMVLGSTPFLAATEQVGICDTSEGATSLLSAAPIRSTASQIGHFEEHGEWHESNIWCDWLGDFIVTRLWNLTANATYTSQNVVDEFEDNFAPEVTKMPGFRAYLGLPLKTLEFSFFFNVFSSAATAAVAQLAAANFVKNGVLHDQIVPVLFTEGQITMQLVKRGLCSGKTPPKLENSALFIQAWRVQELRWDRHLSTQAILKEVATGFGKVVSDYSGFKMLVGAAVEDDGVEYAFLIGIFETNYQAKFAASQIEDFIRGKGVLGKLAKAWSSKGAANLEVEEMGKVDFSFLNESSDTDGKSS